MTVQIQALSGAEVLKREADGKASIPAFSITVRAMSNAKLLHDRFIIVETDWKRLHNGAKASVLAEIGRRIDAVLAAADDERRKEFHEPHAVYHDAAKAPDPDAVPWDSDNAASE